MTPEIIAIVTVGLPRERERRVLRGSDGADGTEGAPPTTRPPKPNSTYEPTFFFHLSGRVLPS